MLPTIPGGIGLVRVRFAALLDEAVVALVAWSGFVDRVF